MKRQIAGLLIIALLSGTFAGCTPKDAASSGTAEPSTTEAEILPAGNTTALSDVTNLDFEFTIEPKTMKLELSSGGVTEIASEPLAELAFSGFKEENGKASWVYDESGIEVSLEKKDKYLDVTIKAAGAEENKFVWPQVSANAYMLPIEQGKYIPSDDELWKNHLAEEEMKLISAFSMQFFAAEKQDFSIVYVIKNPYNNDIIFDTKENTKFAFHHEYPSIATNREYGFRLYLTPKNAVDVAKTYRNYVIETGGFKSLAEKAKDNADVEKLYGAPHAYFWDSSIIAAEDIKWNLLKEKLPAQLKAHIQELLNTKVPEGKEFADAFDTLMALDYADKFTKSQIIKGLTAVLKLNEFYSESIFTNIDSESQAFLAKGINKLNPVELIELNKRLFKSAAGDSTAAIDTWADANTVDVLEDMKASGLDKLWVGLDNWETAFNKPQIVEKATELGYLIGAYDSYHSIHKPGEEQWITAKFTDSSLYENATVQNKSGEKIGGFQNTGRKLNPTLAMPGVKERVSSIFGTGLKFNSWFLDTDATGEVFDDYSPQHTTTEEQDIKARIERMEYLQNEWGLVVGSEGGNDFANKALAFAHGIETPAFSWRDADMKDKASEYYVGKYYSPTGGVPEMFAKQTPVKDDLKKIFLDTKYTIPLYKLVYNDSVITTHWWGWGTLKIKDEVENRMLYEVLYNVPPLYHIDKAEWAANKEAIVKHSKAWSDFSKKAIGQEMTGFKILSGDRTLQLAEYGEGLAVAANFSSSEASFEGEAIAAKSLIIIDNGNITHYKP